MRWVVPAAGLSLASLAQAQPGLAGQLPCTLAGQDAFDASQSQQIKAYVAKEAQTLSGSDTHAASRAREALLAPLACSPISVAFRLEYGAALEPVLSGLVAGKDERTAVNALRIAGRVKTSVSLRPIEAGLASPSPVVRFGAAAAARDLLTQLAIDPLGFPEGNIERLLDQLSQALAQEADPLAADGLVLALGEGPKSSPALRGKSLVRLTSGLTTRVKLLRASPPADLTPWTSPIFRGIDAARLTVLEQIAAGGADKTLASQTALLSGHTLAMARDAFADVTSDESRRASFESLIGAAEVSLVICHNALTGQRAGEKAMQKAFHDAAQSGDPASYRAAIEGWIGAAGLLTKAPYGATAADFAPVP